MKTWFVLCTIVLGLTVGGCDEDNLNIFSVEDDMELGQQVVDEIESNASEYPILDPSVYPKAYAYIKNVRNKLLATGELKYADTFDWDIYIIDQDVLNAFSLPGGTTFYYTGLLKYLDNEASLAGLMAQEFAHVEKRHAITNMTKEYGFSTLLSMILGDDAALAQTIAAELALGATDLTFSSDNEYEAGECAVEYLYATDYDARGVAYFFEKLIAAEDENEDSDGVVYFKTHPNTDDRVTEIYSKYEELGSKSGLLYATEYKEFKTFLP
jgi:predicted Zn-dependent protease